MNLLGTQYTLNMRAYEIYIAGCKRHPHCPGCHNPEGWDFDAGSMFYEGYLERILEEYIEFESIIDRFMIFGGEPLDQPLNELMALLRALKYTGKELWLFTSYEYDEIPNQVLDILDYVKTGQYIEDLPSIEITEPIRITLASNNQKIIKCGGR